MHITRKICYRPMLKQNIEFYAYKIFQMKENRPDMIFEVKTQTPYKFN